MWPTAAIPKWPAFSPGIRPTRSMTPSGSSHPNTGSPSANPATGCSWLQLTESTEVCAAIAQCAWRPISRRRLKSVSRLRLVAQGHGLASEALGAVIARLFEEHGMHRIFAQMDDRNRAAHQVLERLGFRCEARVVEADWFKDEWTTLRIYAVLRRSWE